MKYKDYEGTVEELVRRKIKEIEEKEHIRVLQIYLCERPGFLSFAS